MLEDDHQFPFVSPSIAEVLGASYNNNHSNLVESRTLKINDLPIQDMVEVDLPMLVELAHASDRALFDSSDKDTAPEFRVPLQGLLHLSKQNVMAATLLTLNRLESSIRCVTGHSTGKAPLLKTMLQQLSATNHQLAPILESLLLSHNGLNLRNLLWHGFLADIPRPWFSLVLVLLYNLEQDQETREEAPVQIPALRCYSSLRHLLDDQPILDTDLAATRAWLPPSHQPLFDLATAMRESYPACTAALLGILLEHGLRLDWCQANNCPEDRIARPCSYYVTLDGHGQRHQHDLILHPYRSSGERNALVSHQLDAGKIALLTDLFASSCGGPNIRAALAHGSWDAHLENELYSMVRGETNGVTEEQVRLGDVVQIMLVALKAVASKEKMGYRPLFTYTAVTTRSVQAALHQLGRLEILHCNSLQTNTATVPDSVLRLKVSTEHLRKSAAYLPLANSDAEEWTSDQVFQEYESNVALAGCVASTALLADIVEVSEAYIKLLEEATVDLKSNDLSSRHHKRAKRVCSMAHVALSLYSFATRVVLLFLQYKMVDPSGMHDHQAVMIKAVERCRMCVSTFATFLPTNSDRAVKAVVEFTKGKAVKAVLTILSAEK